MTVLPWYGSKLLPYHGKKASLGWRPDIWAKRHCADANIWTKYPTLKYVRNGILAKREYRGQRSAEAFLKFVQVLFFKKDPLVDKAKARCRLGNLKVNKLRNSYPKVMKLENYGPTGKV
jgi:hypothetical protein